MKITLACAGGMSTGMLVKKMKAAAEKRGLDVEIGAYAVSELDTVGPGSDVILLGPQVSYQKDGVSAQFPGIPVVVINMQDYGMMNGEKVISDVLATLEG